MNTLNARFKMLLLLFPFLYLLHDLEEIFTIEAFLIKHSKDIPIHITMEEFAFAFTLLWIITSIGCFKAYVGRNFLKMKPATYLSFLVPGILLANGIGHFVQYIIFRAYVPGIITSLIIIFPYSFLTAKFLIKERLLTLKTLLHYFIVGFVLQAPLALAAHLLSKLIFSFLF